MNAVHSEFIDATASMHPYLVAGLTQHSFLQALTMQNFLSLSKDQVMCPRRMRMPQPWNVTSGLHQRSH